ncbi:uncharacterized protein METZ01_LOCUS381714 [marine metagenome]|uniref:Uncharacterized protein n=1 Tax=marine metagenome TaxID=408172 RepID=A0A382U3H1_9ZZZZ
MLDCLRLLHTADKHSWVDRVDARRD